MSAPAPRELESTYRNVTVTVTVIAPKCAQCGRVALIGDALHDYDEKSRAAVLKSLRPAQEENKR